MYCRYCGKLIDDGAAFCPHCGSRLAEYAGGSVQTPYQAPAPQDTQQTKTPSTLATVAYVFMIIYMVLSGFFLIPLAWTLPMTLTFKNKIDKGLPVGVGFKVCTLLFVSMIAGILMLCDDQTP